MGTHPIFESDFDCLTECRQNDARKLSVAINHKLRNQPLLRPKSPELCQDTFQLRVVPKILSSIDYSTRMPLERQLVHFTISHGQLATRFTTWSSKFPVGQMLKWKSQQKKNLTQLNKISKRVN